MRDTAIVYTVNMVVNANEHGPFEIAMTATKNLTCLIFEAVPGSMYG